MMNEVDETDELVTASPWSIPPLTISCSSSNGKESPTRWPMLLCKLRWHNVLASSQTVAQFSPTLAAMKILDI